MSVFFRERRIRAAAQPRELLPLQIFGLPQAGIHQKGENRSSARCASQRMSQQKTETIYFEIYCDKLHWCSEANIYGDSESIGHNIKNSNITVLKRQINGAIFKMIENIEKIKITESEGYQQIKESIKEEREKLREIAEDFLDNEGVSNRDIRDAYIDRYVDRNETLYTMKSTYLFDQKYNVLTDVFLVFARAIKDEEREAKILSSLDEAKAENILQEVNEYMKKLETEEYQEELKEELEEI